MSSDATSPAKTPAPWADFPAPSREEWIKRIRKDLKGADIDRLVWHTFDEIDIQPFYTADDVSQRLPLSSDRQGNAWLIRQDINVGEVTNAKHMIREALAGGANSLGLHFSIQVDAALLQSLLEDVALDTVALHLKGEIPPSDLLDMYLRYAKEQDVSPTKLRGSLICNPINALVELGKDELAPQMDEVAGIFNDLQESPNLHLLSVDARPFHNAGATPAQELGSSLAAASEYLVQLREREVSVADLASRLRFEVPVGTSFFPEIAKLRALRLLFPQLVRAFDDQVAPPIAHIRAETSRWSLTLFDPHTNLLRATTEAAAAIVGGCDELSVLPYDAAMDAPSDHARRLALNIQHILKYESHLDVVADPAAGSYYLESLTRELAEAAWSFFQQIEARGGLVAAMKERFIQDALTASRMKRLARVDKGSTALVGTNTFPQAGEKRLPETEEASSDAVPGESSSIKPLPSVRATTHFEALRLRTERNTRTTGQTPSVLPLMLGDPVMANARASFSRNFFGVAGFDILPAQYFETPEDATEAACKAQPDIVVLCSTDASYIDISAPFCQYLSRSDYSPLVVVAGYPKDDLDALKNTGVDAFIHRNTALLDALATFQNQVGLSK